MPDSPVADDLLHLPDGRALESRVLGEPTGPAVVFFGGTPSTVGSKPPDGLR
jgi:hypothetical protein